MLKLNIKNKIVILLLCASVSLIGCSVKNKESSEIKQVTNNKVDITPLRFSNKTSLTDLTKLDGKKVSIVGYMEEVDSDNDKANSYIANVPYPQTHKSFRDILDSIVSITEVDNKDFTVLKGPVIATGYMKIESVKINIRGDSETYKYKMVGVTVRRLTVNEVDENVKTYTKLVDSGFCTDFDEAMKLFSFLEDIKLNPTNARFGDSILKRMDSELDKVGRDKCKNLVIMLDRFKIAGLKMDTDVKNGKKINEEWFMKELNVARNAYRTWINLNVIK
ncbi:hypothetical protein KPL44_23750 [Clostridium sp. DSM 17811]|uniref:hypothetical protein n=1 Tax=Clostridium sp. DSM 17811 TaxID=2843317 RepID=UPI001C0D532E|nr:hypothetical protein [Clostridium sp. DSM 17811]MBU3102257.1 hypothetical protein [Clostridium sp. DSM 17811]